MESGGKRRAHREGLTGHLRPCLLPLRLGGGGQGGAALLQVCVAGALRPHHLDAAPHVPRARSVSGQVEARGAEGMGWEAGITSGERGRGVGVGYNRGWRQAGADRRGVTARLAARCGRGCRGWEAEDVVWTPTVLS
jgi:hypothetical protein